MKPDRTTFGLAAGPPGLPATGPSRRSVLALGAIGLALAGCMPTHEEPRALASGESPTPSPAPVHTVRSLFDSSPFQVAHRGSWDNWPEHTMTAYREAVLAGVPALELSVCATADGILVCHHDTDTARTTGKNLVIGETTWDELSKLRVDARQWLGPHTPLEPIPLLTEVLDAYAATHVIFLEDKQGSNTRPLLDLMDTYPDAHRHIIWKQSAVAAQIRLVTERGYASWGYFTGEQISLLAERYARFTFLGINTLATDEEITAAVATGKPVICWEVHSRAERDRLVGLGVAGLMSANVPYLADQVSAEKTDRFGDGHRAAGDLPWTVKQGWSVQPQLKGAEGILRLQAPMNSSYRMGSMAPVESDVYSIEFEMRWPDRLPGVEGHAGLAFGQDNDMPYRVLIPSEVGGYHFVFRPNGEMTLLLRHAGEADGLRLAVVQTEPATPGEWLSFKIDISPDSLRFSRLDSLGWAGMAVERSYRGGYFSLTRNYAEDFPVEFRTVAIT
ncbi:glycerophosphodiester phosphodiesterase [Arthrobacter yangruifuii]|uniref:glycerophosphodiester phosphodiesterase n=1 Tax=Arthrobacter yangruifuii TaxID=2606616 RepID=UPI0011B513E2|nr:glycerophosphodiester phosphodiesterase [Arthrobacter yangruifuii]